MSIESRTNGCAKSEMHLLMIQHDIIPRFGRDCINGSRNTTCTIEVFFLYDAIPLRYAMLLKIPPKVCMPRTRLIHFLSHNAFGNPPTLIPLL
jgi:hypothetical protein